MLIKVDLRCLSLLEQSFKGLFATGIDLQATKNCPERCYHLYLANALNREASHSFHVANLQKQPQSMRYAFKNGSRASAHFYKKPPFQNEQLRE